MQTVTLNEMEDHVRRCGEYEGEELGTINLKILLLSVYHSFDRNENPRLFRNSRMWHGSRTL